MIPEKSEFPKYSPPKNWLPQIVAICLCACRAIYFAQADELVDDLADGRQEKRLRVVSWNVEKYFVKPNPLGPMKSLQSREAIARGLTAMKPDIILFQELGGEDGLMDIQRRLEKNGMRMEYSLTGFGVDPNLSLGVLSRIPFASAEIISRLEFTHRGQLLAVNRGLMRILVAGPTGQKIEIFNVHLKSRREVSYGDATLIRFQEATLIRQAINRYIAENPSYFRVLGGDMNDSPDTRTLRTLKGSGSTRLEDNIWGLFGERPDGRGRNDAWTLFYEPEQSHHRFDYLMTSPGLKKHIDISASGVFEMRDWGVASDHRPVVLTMDFKP